MENTPGNILVQLERPGEERRESQEGNEVEKDEEDEKTMKSKD